MVPSDKSTEKGNAIIYKASDDLKYCSLAFIGTFSLISSTMNCDGRPSPKFQFHQLSGAPQSGQLPSTQMVISYLPAGKLRQIPSTVSEFSC